MLHNTYVYFSNNRRYSMAQFLLKEYSVYKLKQHTEGKFSRQQPDDIFLLFPRNRK